MDAVELRAAEKWFAHHRGEPITLILAGRIFGGRYGESPQTPRAMVCNGVSLQIAFGTTELLDVVHPSGVNVRPDNALVVHQADRVTFGWHYYGRPQLPENWCEERFELDGNLIHYKRVGPLLPTWHDLNVSEGNMVELALA